jgi:DNA-binding NtrC family response regulator
VATANSAAQADALLQRQVFDLCFLDLRLGEDNGLDVLAQMRIQAPWMRVVIVTAHSAVDTAVDAIQAGAADYLVKPCSPTNCAWPPPNSWKSANCRRAWKPWKAKCANPRTAWIPTARR